MKTGRHTVGRKYAFFPRTNCIVFCFAFPLRHCRLFTPFSLRCLPMDAHLFATPTVCPQTSKGVGGERCLHLSLAFCCRCCNCYCFCCCRRTSSRSDSLNVRVRFCPYPSPSPIRWHKCDWSSPATSLAKRG